jgi:Flp pilus assembly protein CpaB
MAQGMETTKPNGAKAKRSRARSVAHVRFFLSALKHLPFKSKTQPDVMKTSTEINGTKTAQRITNASQTTSAGLALRQATPPDPAQNPSCGNFELWRFCGVLTKAALPGVV